MNAQGVVRWAAGVTRELTLLGREQVVNSPLGWVRPGPAVPGRVFARHGIGWSELATLSSSSRVRSPPTVTSLPSCQAQRCGGTSSGVTT